MVFVNIYLFIPSLNHQLYLFKWKISNNSIEHTKSLINELCLQLNLFAKKVEQKNFFIAHP